ncbi:MAG TPA: Rrf2 family transcriptional regulator [Candidatus Marinimicrobia bacterium]|nr:Rrf2 family transcriptional regulator [Candidatus Neomarinimicrobiota bacterium]
MKLISLSAQYALTALMILAKEKSDSRISANELSRRIGAPKAYLSQVMAKLIPLGIVNSSRGKSGGVALAKSADDINVLDIIIAIDSEALFGECVLGFPSCGDDRRHFCPMHKQWGMLREQIRLWMADTSLARLAADMDAKWMDNYMNFNKKEEM